MKRVENLLLALAMLALSGMSGNASAGDYDNVDITVTRVADNVYMLLGAGGNIGVGAGPDGVFLIDDQFAPLTGKIQAALSRISTRPVRFLLNTHWHFDHTGGNENFGGQGVVIVAHDNVRKRMSVDNFIKAFKKKVPATAAVGLPVITFSEEINFHLNGDRIEVLHLHNAHTDGDSVVIFHKANVVHMGDIMFAGMYPFIDIDTGGSIDGVIAAVDRVLPMIDDQTQVIPGHGPLSDKAGLRHYRDVLVTIRDRVAALIGQGKTLQQVLDAAPGAGFDADWGHGFLTPEVFIGIVYADLIR